MDDGRPMADNKAENSNWLRSRESANQSNAERSIAEPTGAIELKRERRINSITRSVLGDSTITEAELQLDSATEKSPRKPIAQRLCRIKPHGLGYWGRRYDQNVEGAL